MKEDSGESMGARDDEFVADIKEINRELDQVQHDFTELRTEVVGIRGDNGIKGRVAALETKFSHYRQAMRGELKRMEEKHTKQITQMFEKIEADHAERRREHRQNLAAVMGVGVFIVAAMTLLFQLMGQI